MPVPVPLVEAPRHESLLAAPISALSSSASSGSAARLGQKQPRATFLGRVFDMLATRSANDPTLSWSMDGTALVIWRREVFEREVLPAFFPSQKLSTFFRSIQRFAFKRMTAANGAISFAHPALTHMSSREDFLAVEPKDEVQTANGKQARLFPGLSRRTLISKAPMHALPATVPIYVGMYCAACLRMPPLWTECHDPNAGRVLRCNYCWTGYPPVTTLSWRQGYYGTSERVLSSGMHMAPSAGDGTSSTCGTGSLAEPTSPAEEPVGKITQESASPCISIDSDSRAELDVTGPKPEIRVQEEPGMSSRAGRASPAPSRCAENQTSQDNSESLACTHSSTKSLPSSLASNALRSPNPARKMVRFADEVEYDSDCEPQTPLSRTEPRQRYECEETGCGVCFTQEAALEAHCALMGH
ncbi:C2H2-type domain-containing protein [Mycena chlorophos]|uniref:C2H2-type domain-containing protein n=1 Tax=Mycena chlorophos TaxID=658473 RepID=A0A8H6SUF6_MYCCL|nr:C2H2-type domain-containing protein [Mycena chlorophos]